MIRGGRVYAAGVASAPALVLAEPLSLWGGIDGTTGIIVDRSHPDRGRCLAGQVLVMGSGRGSSSSSSVLAEAIRSGVGPVGILLARADPILTVGCLVADALYGLRCPLVVCAIEGIGSGDTVTIATADDGTARIEVVAAAPLSPA